MAGAMLEIAQNYADSNPKGSLPLLVQRRSMSQRAHRVSLGTERLISLVAQTEAVQSLTHRQLGNTIRDRPG